MAPNPSLWSHPNLSAGFVDIWRKNIAINAGIDPGGSQFCRGVKSIPINGVFDMSTCDVKTAWK